MPEYSDDLGSVVELERTPTRIVSLVPSLTEAIAASVPGVLIGATDWCTHPADLDVVRLGGTKNPDLGSIVDLAPDLVIANEEENRRQDVEELRARGIAVWVTDIRSVDGALSSIARLLDVLGAHERSWLDQAEVAWAGPARVAHAPVRALIPIWRRPWMALGSDTYAGDVLARIGVTNVLAGSDQRYPRIDLAELIDEAGHPSYDVVLLPDEPYAFSPADGPEAFPDVPIAYVDGRALTWYGPSMIAAPESLLARIDSARALTPPAEPRSTMRPIHTDELLVSAREGVVDIVFNRPHRHNAFTTPMYSALQSIIDDLAQDDSVRVVVLRGAGSVAFAAGNDISEFASMTTGAEAVRYESRVRDMLQALATLPQVTVAAIDGLCVGGGLAVATYCDLRLATAASRFGYPIARTLGNALSRPLLERCVHVFGESLTREMLLASRMVDAQRAYGVGALMHVAATSSDLEKEVQAVVDGLMHAAPLTLQATKEQLAEITAYGGDVERDERLLERVYSSAGFAEGVRAFLAKEKPQFPAGG